MSKLGDVNNIYGKQFNLIRTNADGNKLLSMHGLPGSSLILSAIENEDIDLGVFSLFATDVNGDPVRLTYTLQAGNGFNLDNDNKDIIKVNIDNETIIEENKNLQVNKTSLIDNDTIQIKNNKLKVNTQALKYATVNTPGIIEIDNSTVKINNTGNIYIETSNLSVTNGANYGVIQSDGHTLDIDINGVISVNTNNLTKGTKDNFGISTVDNQTIKSNNGEYFVDTQNLTKASSRSLGISKADGNTIKVNKDNEYTVNTENLTKASSDSFGVVKTDNNSISVENGLLTMKQYQEIHDNSYKMKSDIEKLNTKVKQLKKMLQMS